MPLEIMAASITLEYWNSPIPAWASITFFLLLVILINLCGVKTYGEAEYAFSILKVTAVIGFIILGAVINVRVPEASLLGSFRMRGQETTQDHSTDFTSVVVAQIQDTLEAGTGKLLEPSTTAFRASATFSSQQRSPSPALNLSVSLQPKPTTRRKHFLQQSSKYSGGSPS
jgi:amino acid transporter